MPSATPVSTPLTPKGAATRARLLACARAEAVRTGGLVEVAAVAGAAGVAPSLVYRYFGTKSGLVGALVDDFFDRMHAEALDVDLDAETSWARRERRRLALGVRFHYSDPFVGVLYGSLARDPAVNRTEAVRIEKVIDYAATSIRRAQQTGELSVKVDSTFAGAAMFGAMQRIMLEALRRSPRPSEEIVTDLLWRQVAASVRVDPDAVMCLPPRYEYPPRAAG